MGPSGGERTTSASRPVEPPGNATTGPAARATSAVGHARLLARLLAFGGCVASAAGSGRFARPRVAAGVAFAALARREAAMLPCAFDLSKKTGKTLFFLWNRATQAGTYS